MFQFKLGFLDVDFLDLLDVVLVAVLVYQVYYLIRGSIASRVFMGYVLVYGFYLLVRALGMELLSSILGQFMQVGVLALLVIFQPEIRRFLLVIGRSTNVQNTALYQRFFGAKLKTQTTWELQPLLDAVKVMAIERTGALLVIQKEDGLKRYIESGEEINAVLSKPLLIAIFNKTSPLHDGAVILAGKQIRAAGCMLPVSESERVTPAMGFRHRAALGMAEQTDAAVVVVSEETGEVMFVTEDDLVRNVSLATLESRLVTYLTKPAEEGNA
jgi:diadenylate cyclase